jgi:Tol biopolymer transport system component
MYCLKYLLILLPLGLFAQSPLVMHPAISPDAKTLAFSFQGDIWTMPLAGGPALRLTIHEGYESRPIWSPDGKNIAFGSDRNGNNDVFIVASGGGTPKQLTWGSYSDMPISWEDNETVLFTTRRLFAQVERELEIYKVSAKGSTPERKLDALAMEALYSDRKSVV